MAVNQISDITKEILCSTMERSIGAAVLKRSVLTLSLLLKSLDVSQESMMMEETKGGLFVDRIVFENARYPKYLIDRCYQSPFR